MTDHERRDATGPGVDDDTATLLGAYALDALDDVERHRVERLIDSDPAARAELDRLLAATDRLADAAAVGERAPSGLWGSIAAQLDAPPVSASSAPGAVSSVPGAVDSPADRPTADATADVGTAAPPPMATAPISLDARRARRRPGAWVLSAAAAVVLLVAGIAVGSRIGDDDATDPLVAMQELAAQAASQPGARTAELTDADATMAVKVVADPAGHAFVMADQLPALTSGEIYQLWAVDGGTPISLGLLGSDPIMSVVGVDGRVTTLAITREPAGGSADPTTAPMASGTLEFA